MVGRFHGMSVLSAKYSRFFFDLMGRHLMGGTHLNGVGNGLTFLKSFCCSDLFCYSWFRLQLISDPL